MIELVSSNKLAQIFAAKFKFSMSKATKLARFLVEGVAASDSEEDKMIEKRDHTADLVVLIERLRQHIGDYAVPKPFAITSMFRRLQDIVEGKLEELKGDMDLEAENEYEEWLSMEVIWRLWKELMIPMLDEDMQDFVEMYALRCSDSLKRVNYKEFGKIFDEDFTTEPCSHDDAKPFDSSKEEIDDQ